MLTSGEALKQPSWTSTTRKGEERRETVMILHLGGNLALDTPEGPVFQGLLTSEGERCLIRRSSLDSLASCCPF